MFLHDFLSAPPHLPLINRWPLLLCTSLLSSYLTLLASVCLLLSNPTPKVTKTSCFFNVWMGLSHFHKKCKSDKAVLRKKLTLIIRLIEDTPTINKIVVVKYGHIKASASHMPDSQLASSRCVNHDDQYGLIFSLLIKRWLSETFKALRFNMYSKSKSDCPSVCPSHSQLSISLVTLLVPTNIRLQAAKYRQTHKRT